MDHLNSGSLQLGLFALVFGSLQVWWISGEMQHRDLEGLILNQDLENLFHRHSMYAAGARHCCFESRFF